MRSRKLVIATGLLVAFATSVPALAQQATGASGASGASSKGDYPAPCTAVPQAMSNEAHAVYQRGKSFYDEGNFDLAIQLFRESYKKDCSKPELLIAISRAYEQKADNAAAANALELYLARVPSSPDAAQHREHIELLRKDIAKAPPPPPPPPTASTGAAPPPPPPEVREHTVAPWIVVGIGAAAAVVGIVVVATSPSLPTGCNAASKTCTPIVGETTAQFNDRQDAAGKSQSQPGIGEGIAIGGGVLVLGGLLWHFLEPTGPVEKSGKLTPSVTPVVTAGFAGMSLGGSF